MKLKILAVSIVSVLASGCSLFGYGNEEQPEYKIIMKDGNIEVRKYEPYIVAKTTVQGNFEEAQSKGFKVLAGYIFGENKTQKKISMTSPVVQKEAENEKIAMTAPVTLKQEKNNQDSWTMTFSMPSKYTLKDLPSPVNNNIKFEVIPKRLVAAYRFTGFWGKEKNKEKEEQLLKWLADNKSYEPISKAMFAGYNPPWTIPFLRRNEILIELQQRNN